MLFNFVPCYIVFCVCAVIESMLVSYRCLFYTPHRIFHIYSALVSCLLAFVAVLLCWSLFICCYILYKLWNRLVCYYVSFAASCKHVQCPVGQHCLEDQNLMPHCVTCSITCPPYDAAVKSVISNPARLVCGVDGNTYRNLCEIKRTACMLGRSIPVAYRGTCRGKKEFCLRLTLYLFEGSI